MTALLAQKSSPTPGEAIRNATRVATLLTPVLKDATPAQIKNLERRASEVQNIFRRLLAGDGPVRDYSPARDQGVRAEVIVRHTDSLQLRDPLDRFPAIGKDVRFSIRVAPIGETEPDMMRVIVRALREDGGELKLLPDWRFEFERLAQIDEREDRYVSLASMAEAYRNGDREDLAEAGRTDPESLAFWWSQAVVLAEGKLELFVKDPLEGIVHIKLDVPSRRGGIVTIADEEISCELLKALV